MAMFLRLTASHIKETIARTSRKVVTVGVPSHQNVYTAVINSSSKIVNSLGSNRGTPLSSQRRTIFSLVSRPKVDCNLGQVGYKLPCLKIVARGTKTKKAAAKRFIAKGNGDLKYGHAGKRHNTSKRTKNVKRRLNKKVIKHSIK